MNESRASTVKRLSTLHAHLRSAAGYLGSAVPPGISAGAVGLADVERLLSDTALLRWMSDLAAAAEAGAPRAGFWRDLERAAEAAGVPIQAARYRERFLMAVAGEGEPRP